MSYVFDPNPSGGGGSTDVLAELNAAAALEQTFDVASPTAGTNPVPHGMFESGIDDAKVYALDYPERKASVRAATTASITLSGTQTVDGVALAAGDRVLVRAQSTPSQNGLYLVASGAWARTSDGLQTYLRPGTVVLVREGTTLARSVWTLANTGAILVGTTGQTWARLVTEADLRAAAAGLTAALDVGGQQVTNAATPTTSSALTTKAYVDQAVSDAQALLDWHPSVRAVATSNVASLSGTTTLDGVSLVAGDRVLLTGQTTASQNGLWVVASGAWARPADSPTGGGILSAGAVVTVTESATGNTGLWRLTNADPITVGTTAQTWARVGLVLEASNTPNAVSTTGSPGSTGKAADAGHTHALTETTLRAVLATAAAAVEVGGQQVTDAADGTAVDHLATVGQVPGLGAAGSLVIAGTGALTVTAAQWAYSILTLTGALTGDRTLTLTTVAGRRCLVRHSATGTYLLKVIGSGGGATYLLPGQAKLLGTDASGVLIGDDLRSLVYESTQVLTGSSGGATYTLCALPADCAIDLVEAYEYVATVQSGGAFGPTLVMGTNATAYDNILIASALGTAGKLHGQDKTKLGALMSTDGYGVLTAAATLAAKTVLSGSATAGALRFLFRGRWLG